jgi:DNA-binding PadR family transcriptional regulator
MVYSDNTLLPKEALRLAILGMLAEGERSYAALSKDVRRFISRLAGPSLDLMGASIELLRYEGFVATVSGDGADAILRLTDAGRAQLETLLNAPVGGQATDTGRLVFALKMRFLHLLEPAARRDQLASMEESCRTELARLADLEAGHSGTAGYFAAYLAHDSALIAERLKWIAALREEIAAA